MSEQNTQRSAYESPYHSQNVSDHNDSQLKELNEYRDKVFELEQMLAEYLKEKEMNKKYKLTENELDHLDFDNNNST